MNTINGEKYYISLGYINEENINQEQGIINPKDIHNLIMTTKDMVLYIDDSDKSHLLAMPIMIVDDIENIDGIYKFNIIINANKTIWVTESKDLELPTINVLGLFARSIEDNKEYVRNISFFICEPEFLHDNRILSICVEVNEEKILGE